MFQPSLANYYQVEALRDFFGSMLIVTYTDYIQAKVSNAYIHSLLSIKTGWELASLMKAITQETQSAWFSTSTRSYVNELLDFPLSRAACDALMFVSI